MTGRMRSWLVVIVLLCVGVYTCAHKTSEHRAEYPGRMTFAGRPRNIFGSTYTRAFWRLASSKGTLPDVTLHVDGRPYKLFALTPEFMDELSGGRMKGRLVDAEGKRFSYRFEQGRLVWFSLGSMGEPQEPPDRNAETVSLSIGDGLPFTVPITDRELTRRTGRPKSTYLTSGQ
ncbi:MAG TPA: hypothetical protein VMZ06_16090 [Candidatus Bathyarchaeia archaeon]|nr:hypothetical protein [Candidatus Bathyarchaeia archaeon]